MQSFTLKPACRVERETSVWDRDAGHWKTHLLKKPKLIINPAQQYTEEQQKFLKEYEAVLAETIRLNNELNRGMAERQKQGPDEFIGVQYRIACQFGFHEIEEEPKMRQSVLYLWDLSDRNQAGLISWEEFEDEVERWTLMVLEKLATLHGPKVAACV